MASADPNPAQLLLDAVDALPAKDRKAVLLWLIDPSPLSTRGAWALRNYSSGLAARLPELPPRAHEFLLRRGVDIATSDTRADEVSSGERLQVVPIRLTGDQHARLRRWCARHNFTMATVVRGLVDRFLDDQEPTPSEEA